MSAASSSSCIGSFIGPSTADRAVAPAMIRPRFNSSSVRATCLGGFVKSHRPSMTLTGRGSDEAERDLVDYVHRLSGTCALA